MRQAEHGEGMGDGGVGMEKSQCQRGDEKAVVAALVGHGGAHDVRFFLAEAEDLAAARLEQDGFQQHDVHAAAG
jgi:hypothetical protein